MAKKDPNNIKYGECAKHIGQNMVNCTECAMEREREEDNKATEIHLSMGYSNPNVANDIKFLRFCEEFKKESGKAFETARSTSISLVLEENGSIVELQPDGTKKTLKKLPKSKDKLPKKFTLTYPENLKKGDVIDIKIKKKASVTSDNSFTHNKLVESAYRWVLKNSSCGVAFKELNTTACNGEYPDVIGFGAWGHSVLIECKTSRADFHADKKKHFRQYPNLGMGTQRFYCCPKGLLKVEDLPKGWGLIYVNERFKAICVYTPYKGNIGERHDGFEKNTKAEHGLMYSALRRLHLRGRIDEIYDDAKERKAQNEQFDIWQEDEKRRKAENLAGQEEEKRIENENGKHKL